VRQVVTLNGRKWGAHNRWNCRLGCDPAKNQHVYDEDAEEADDEEAEDEDEEEEVLADGGVVGGLSRTAAEGQWPLGGGLPGLGGAAPPSSSSSPKRRSGGRPAGTNQAGAAAAAAAGTPLWGMESMIDGGRLHGLRERVEARKKQAWQRRRRRRREVEEEADRFISRR
jgi:hypothetical protein